MINAARANVRVLLVEDDEEDAHLTSRLLLTSSDRYSISWSQTGAQALDALRQEHHDVMLLDYRLATETGLDILRSTRARGDRIPAILLTGQTDASLDDMALEAGVVDFLDKNRLDARELDRTLRYVVERSHMERDRMASLAGERKARIEAESAHRHTVSILESIAEAFLALDDQWTITFANTAACNMSGMPRTALIGANFWETFPLGETERDTYRSAMRDRIDRQFEIFYEPLNIWVAVHIHPGPAGLSVYTSDITARKVAEQGQKELEGQLEGERALFAAVLHQLPIGVIVGDVPSGRLRLGNAEIERMWRQPFIASPDVEGYRKWRGFHEDGRPYEPHEWPLARTVNTGERVTAEIVQILRGDDTPATVRINSGLIHDRDGGAMAAVVTLEDVTKSREIEDAVRFQARLLDVVEQAIIATDATGVVIYWNRYAQELYGWTPAEAVGRAIDSVVTVEQAPSDAAKVFARLVAGESWAGELDVHGGNGRSFPALVTASPILDASDHLIGIVAASVDVTQQRKAEQVLRESEAFFRAAFISSPVSSTLTSPTGQIIQANPAFGELLGYDSTDLVGRQLIDFTHSDDTAAIIEVRKSILDGESDTRQHEKRYVHRSGRVIDCVASVGVVRGPDGQPLYFTTQVIDTSDRKRAEAAESKLLNERTEALVAIGRREQHFRSLIENATDPVIIMSGAGIITYATPAFELLTGMTPDAVTGMSVLELVHPEDAQQARESIRRVLEDPDQPVVVELRVRHRDGVWRSVKNTARNLLAHSAVGGIVVNLRDVTDEKMLAQQLRQAQKLEAVGQLAGGIAHDFNNILTVIKVNGEFLLGALDSQDPRRGEVTEIGDAADRAAGLTRQLLAFSRQQILQPREMDISAAVDGIIPMLRRLIGEDIEIDCKRGSDDLYALADPGQVEQVMMNLAINARDAMPRGGSLSIRTERVMLDEHYATQREVIIPGPYVLLSVSDTGTGMDRRTCDRIFEPFFTTKDVGKGTGLGLATVYGIIKQSRGYIWVYSEPGQGSTFKIYLPLISSGGPCEPAQPQPTVRGGNETVLLAEDEESVRSLTRRILNRHGYLVLEARHGAEALELASTYSGRIDLVITDVVMPHMNGRELIEHLSKARPETRVLYTSGYTKDDIVRRQALEPRGGQLLQKPFSATALAAVVRQILDAPAGTRKAPLS